MAQKKNLRKLEATEQVNKLVAENLKALRRIYGLSQQQCGDVLGCTAQQIQKYENNINRLSIAQMLRLADFMGVDPDAFFRDNSTEPTATHPRHIGECLSYLSPEKRHFLLKIAQELIHV